MPLWHSDTPGWDSDAEQMCLSITLITVFTHTILYSEIKSTQTSYLWKVLFPNVIEIRIPAHPSGKEKKNKNKNTNENLGYLQRRQVACGEGPLEMWKGSDYAGV